MQPFPTYRPDISNLLAMNQASADAQRMYLALYEFIRAHVRHAQDLSWLDGLPVCQDLFHQALELAIPRGRDAVRILAAQEGLKKEKAAASFRQFVEDHPDAFAEFYFMLDQRERGEMELAGIDTTKYLDQIREYKRKQIP